MSVSDILNGNSTEIKELFSTIEKIKDNVFNNSQCGKTALSNEIYLNNNDVCEMLHLSSRTLQDYRDKGIISFYKIEGKILYKMSDIQNMLEKNYYEAWRDYE